MINFFSGVFVVTFIFTSVFLVTSVNQNVKNLKKELDEE